MTKKHEREDDLLSQSKYQKEITEEEFFLQIVENSESKEVKNINQEAFIKDCSLGKITEVRNFLRQEKEAINRMDKDGNYPLISAVENNRKAIVEYLISQKEIDVNIKKHNKTALHIACQNLNYEIFQILARHPKSDLDVEIDGKKPLDMAKDAIANILNRKDKTKIKKVDKNRRENSSFFIIKWYYDNPDFPRFDNSYEGWRIFREIDLNGKNLVAVLSDFEDNLLKFRNKEGEDLLNYAIRNDKFECLLILLPQFTKHVGRAEGLISLISQKHSDQNQMKATNLILERDILFTNINDSLLVKELVNKNPILKNATDVDGDSLLMLACQNQNKDLADFLIKAGANINYLNRVDDFDVGAINRACFALSLEMVNLLISHGLKPEEYDASLLIRDLTDGIRDENDLKIDDNVKEIVKVIFKEESRIAGVLRDIELNLKEVDDEFSEIPTRSPSPLPELSMLFQKEDSMHKN